MRQPTRPATHAQYQHILDRANDGIFIAQDRIICYVNQYMSTLTDCSAAEMLGKQLEQFIAQKQRADFWTWQHQRTSGASTSACYEFSLLRKDGSHIFVEVSITDIEYKGKPALLGILRDISEHKNMGRRFEQSATVLQSLMDAIPVPVFVRDESHKYIQVNKAFCDYAGKTKEELLGKCDHDLLPPSVAAVYEERINSIFAAGKLFESEEAYENPDGTQGDVWVRAIPTTLSDGQKVLVTTTLDITDRKMLERQLRDSAQFTEAVLNTVPDPIMVKDEASRFIKVNKAFCQLVGKSANELNGKTTKDIASVSEAVRFEAQDEHTFATGQLLETEEIYTSPTGRKHHLLVKKVVHELQDGQQFLTTLLQDVTEQKIIEEQLRNAKEAAEIANRTKSAFLSTMTHELRTPMNGVLGMTTLLSDTELNAEQLNLVSAIRTSGDALLNVINQILDFSKIEADKLELERTSFDIRSMIEQTLDLVAPLATEKELILAYFLNEDVPLQLVQDVARLRQIVTNLVGNAIKFTPQGEVTVSISVQHRHEERYQLQFAVQDTGIGIPADRIEHLFQSFHQSDASISRRFGGTGLGLAISKRLAEAMGGSMWVESTVGEGTTFYFTITAQVASPSQVLVGTAGNPAPRLYGGMNLGRISNKQVLLVAKHATMQRLVKQHLQAWSVSLTTVPTCANARTEFADGDFDAVIVDSSSCDSSAEALILLRKELGERFPLILLTSLGDRSTEQDDYVVTVTKPVHASHLHDALVTVIYGKWAKQLQSVSAPLVTPDLSDSLPLRILLAEDNLVNQHVALGFLSKYGYTADVAGNGLEVLDALERQFYDLILMDVNMPEMDGLAATSVIRSNTDNPQPYIIAMTANAMYEDRKHCLSVGMNDYISKPLRLENLSKAFQRLKKTLAGKADDNRRQDNVTHSTPSAQNSGEKPVDPMALQEFVALMGNGGAAMAAELVRLYLEGTPQLIDEFQHGLATQNMDSIQHATHTLRSGSAQIGAHRLATIAVELDELCDQNNLPAITARAGTLIAEYERVMTYFQTKYNLDIQLN